MKQAIMPLGETSRIDHELLGDVERSARGQGDAQERAFARIVIFGENPFAVGDDRVVVLDQSFVGNATVRKAEIDGTTRQRDAHSQFRSFFGLDVNGVGHIVRKDEQVIRGGTAAGDQQFGQRDAYGETEAIAIKTCAPDRIKLLQSWKQVLVDGLRMRARQRLEKMMMSVDKAWDDDVPPGIENLVAGCCRAILPDKFDDLAILDDKPALASFRQHCDRIANPGFHRFRTARWPSCARASGLIPPRKTTRPARH
jgi:hypothetical protein